LPIDPKKSVDPNDKGGPPGVGSAKFVAGDVPLSYTIHFENLETATAPAQVVEVTDQLDPLMMDLDTFRLGPISFGDNTLLPAPGVKGWTGGMDLRPDQNLIVMVKAALDKNTGLVTWNFMSIDPDTGQLTDYPDAGFLPPNTTPPAGEGSVVFTVMPKAGLSTGTLITNQAQIVFEVNAPINTPSWANTIDSTKPTSQVLPLPPTVSSTSFPVQWSGTDTGAGISDFTIFVSDNGGPFNPFVSNTTSTSATFSGQNGHTYAFYSVATDWVGNIEDDKTVPDASTKVIIGSSDDIPPSSTALVSTAPNGAGWNNSDVTVTLSAVDNPGGSGVKQIIYSASGALTIGSTTVSGALASGVIAAEGQTTITFFATDNADNVETPKSVIVKLDKTPPLVTCSASPNLLWPPNHKMITINTSVSVVDSLSGSDGFRLISVASNEQDTGLGSGDFPKDIEGFVIGTPDTRGQLRAERSGQGSGRIYTLIYEGMDLAGNSSTCNGTVTVPHDQRK